MSKTTTTDEPSLKQKNPYLAVVLIPLVIIILFFAIRSFFGSLIANIIIYGFETNYTPVNQLLRVLALNFLVLLATLVVIYMLAIYKKIPLVPQRKFVHYRVTNFLSIYFIATGSVFVFNFIITVFSLIFGIESQSSYELIFPTPVNITPINIILLFLVLCVLAPILEEFIFRAELIPLLENCGFGTKRSIIISSIAFALAHSESDILNGNVLFTVNHFVATFILGLSLGIVYCHSRDFRVPVFYHALNNFFPSFLVITVAALSNYDITATDLQNAITIPPSVQIITLLALFQSLAGIAIACWFFFNKTKLYGYRQIINYRRPAITDRKGYSNLRSLGVFFIVFFALYSTVFPVLLTIFLDLDFLAIDGFTSTFIHLIIDTGLLIVIILIYIRNFKLIMSSSLNSIFELGPGQFSSHSHPIEAQNTIEIDKKLPQKYCGYCGASLSVTTQASSKFCPNCGQPLLRFVH